VPGILHVLKLYTLQVILAVLRHKVCEGTFSSRFKVPVRLQRAWHLQFRQRMRRDTDFTDPDEYLTGGDLQTITAPVGMIDVKERANAIGWFSDRTESHHRLAFYSLP